MAGFYFAKVRFWVKTKKNMCQTTTYPRAKKCHNIWCCIALVCIDTIEVIMGDWFDTSAIAYSSSAIVHYFVKELRNRLTKGGS